MTCTNMFLEEDNYCTKCGNFHVPAKKSQPTKANRTIIEKKNSIAMTIQSTPQYSEAKNLVQKIASDYGIQVKVIFRNVQVSHATPSEGLIVLGYQSLDRSYQTGMTEYAKTEWILWKYFGKNKVTGIDGAKLEAIHEVAHILSYELNDQKFNYRGSKIDGHDRDFQNVYSELISQYLQ